MTLTEFLMARFAEDEVAAKVCADVYPSPWEVSDRGHTATVRADWPNFWPVTILEQFDDEPGLWLGEYVEHIARHDPDRVLAEVEAKRRIVTRGPSACGGHEDQDAFGSHHYPDPEWTHCDGCSAAESSDRDWRWTLTVLALPYADHPDFRPEWRP